jgi:SAM-dependent methyltransferase
VPESVNFDRIADRYDETRGGAERGRLVAAQVAPYLPPGRLLEIGVGTGLIATEFAALGWEIVGLDLSARMLVRAARRVPGRVVRADAGALPLADGSVDACAAVHVLHLVGDTSPVLREVARVLRPAGRLAVTGRGSYADVSDLGRILRALNSQLDGRQPRAARSAAGSVIETAAPHGLRLVEQFAMTPRDAETTPEQAIAGIESRLWSSLWDVPDDLWASVVEPAVAELRRLPGQDQPRRATSHDPVLIFEATADTLSNAR